MAQLGLGRESISCTGRQGCHQTYPERLPTEISLLLDSSIGRKIAEALVGRLEHYQAHIV